ncbi:MAG: reverse gyrase [Candidatus Nitrosothermus koennekii]|nr:MAG: reverse gyrase [Candidatus Nitrosothermus koennekii]
MKSIFKDLCINCGNEITDERLKLSMPCDKCIDHIIDEEDIIEKQIKIGRYLEVNNKLMNYAKIYNEAKAFREFEELFEKAYGFKLRSAQKEWAIRFLREESFSIIAATGLGKTHFGIFASVFNALKGKNSYIIMPTHLLVEQAYSIASSIIDRLDLKIKIVKIHSKMKAKEREESIKALNKADLLITTSSFLARRFDDINNKFNLIFVDDTDSLLKRSKNAIRVLRLIGYKEDEIKKAIDDIRTGKFDEHKSKGIVIVSSATIKPRGIAPLLFRHLLGFDIGISLTNVRNIVDTYTNERIDRLVKRLGSGGLIFVSIYDGEDSAIQIAELLKSKGIKAEAYVSSNANPKIFEKFRNGDIDILVGVATYYGMLVRGLNLPERIRYTIFTSVPKIRFRLSELNPNTTNLFFTIFRRYIPKRYKDMDKSPELIKQILNDKEFLDAIRANPTMKVTSDSIEMPDVRTYIQASGRTSRLYAGGVTKGLSVIIADDLELLKALEFQLQWYFEDVQFKELKEIDITRILKEIDEDRRKLSIIDSKKDLVKTTLLIVESPNKAETIARLFGKPSKRRRLGINSYEVTIGNYLINIVASKGHILDLVEEGGEYGVLIKDSSFIPIYSTIKRCNKCSYQFIYSKSCPRCLSNDIDDAITRIERIRELAYESDVILLGTDPDREGEKISWDLEHMIKPVNNNIQRIEFHEVTSRSIRRAIDEQKAIDNRLVDAQMVRRIEDRWLGFELSQILWNVFNNKTLSAGRVQTPVLGWIIDRYDQYIRSKQYVLTLTLENGFRFNINYKEKPQLRLKELSCKLEEEVREVDPKPPFSTDSLLYEAFKQLHFNANQTMQLAQDLFELGLITYHRTDSIRVSKEGMELAKRYLEQTLDNFNARGWSKEGAHECIRPTKPLDLNALLDYIREVNIKNITPNHLKLYSLIFKRFIASQMKSAKIRYQIADIIELNTRIEFPISIEDYGFTSILPIRIYDKIKSRVKITYSSIKKKPTIYPYTQGELVKDMKDKGIGRPSTYSIIISKILDRRYAIDSKGFLIPTKLGRKVYDFLSTNYKKVVSEEFTRELEAKMDEIEEGADANKILLELYELYKSIKPRAGFDPAT